MTLVSFGGWALLADDLTGAMSRAIVVEGRPAGSILIRKDCPEREAEGAQEIQDYVAKATGVRLPIVADANEAKGHVIRILTREPAEGESSEAFSIKVADNETRIEGNSPLGTLYGVYELLERGVGVRWYLPGPLGEVVPECKTLILPSLDIKQSPSMEMRWIGKDALDESGDERWSVRNKQNACEDGFCMHPDSPFHGQCLLLPADEYFEARPEYYALIDGKRRRLNNSVIKLCYANPDVVREIVKNISSALDTNTNIDVISFAPSDNANWCECEGCKAMDEEGVPHGQSKSRRNLIFYNAVAAELRKSHPEAKMLVGAYSDYILPPKDPSLKVDPMFSVMITHYGFCHAHPVSDLSCSPNGEYAERIKLWQDRGCGIYFYEYYWKLAWRGLPWPIVHSIKVDIPWFREQGYKGLYTQYTKENIWTLYPNHYVAARLLWDVNADVDAIVSRMYEDLYGAAAPHIKAYYALMERQMAECGPHIHGYRPYFTGPAVFTQEVVAELRDHYDKAVKANADGTVALRLKKVGASLEYVERTRRLWDLWPNAWVDNAEPAKPMIAAKQALEIIDSLITDFTEDTEKWEGVVWREAPDLKNDRTKLLGRIAEIKALNNVVAYATAAGIVAHWPLSADSGDTARDVGLNQLNGKIVGAKWVKGDIRTALEFNGRESTVDCGPGRALALKNALTFSLWMRPDRAPEGEQVLVGESTDSYAITYYKMRAHFYINSGGVRNSARVAVPLGEWSHVVGTFDGKTSRLYLNGSLRFTVESEGMDMVDTRHHFGICPRTDARSGYYGLLDDVRVYNRVLGDDEVLTLYNNDTLETATVRPETLQTLAKPPPLQGWVLQFADDFEGGELATNWEALRGDWLMEEGRLTVLGHGQIMCTKTFPGAQRLEFDAMAEDPCDLTGVICASPLGYRYGYFVGFGTANNAYSKLLVQAVEVNRWDAVIKPGKIHHQIVQREGNTITHVVDGTVVMTYHDDEPLKGEGHDRIGFYVFGSSQMIDNVRVYTKPGP